MPKNPDAMDVEVNKALEEASKFLVSESHQIDLTRRATVRTINSLVEKMFEFIKKNDILSFELVNPTPSETKTWQLQIEEFKSKVKEFQTSISNLEMLLDKSSVKKSTSRANKKGITLHVDPAIDAVLKQLASNSELSIEYLMHRGILLLLKEFNMAIPFELEERLARPAINPGGRPKKRPPSPGG